MPEISLPGRFHSFQTRRRISYDEPPSINLAIVADNRPSSGARRRVLVKATIGDRALTVGLASFETGPQHADVRNGAICCGTLRAPIGGKRDDNYCKEQSQTHASCYRAPSITSRT